MKLLNYLEQDKKTYFSFELLPPLKGRNLKEVFEAIDPLIEYEPININVTYHQDEIEYIKHHNGFIEKKTLRKRPGTVAMSAAINNKYPKPEVIPHIICGGLSKETIENMLIDLNFLGISNVLALRGDAQKTEKYFVPEQNGHEHTIGLVQQIMNLNKGIYLNESLKNSAATDFIVGVAGYPEKHIEAPNFETDLMHLKNKVDAGAQYIVTQMFFDNKKYFDFVKTCRKIGINVPIIPGIKPIRNKLDLKLLPQTFSIDIPNELVTEINNAKDDNQVMQIGIEWTVKQSNELKAQKVPVIHYYTIGKSDNVVEIAKRVF